jgi:PIN domain nuclease of toxin-antitoxin system
VAQGVRQSLRKAPHPLIYLDTHVVAWLYAGAARKLTPLAKREIEQGELRVAPIVQLELEYLFELGRVRERAAPVLATLANRTGLAMCDRHPVHVMARACELSWTRDVFDRMIVAQASINADLLLTADETIRKHYPKARW